MDMQRVTRRMVLGLFVTGVALPIFKAEATVVGPSDFGSRKDFEDLCRAMDGTFTDTGDGNLW